MIKCPLCGSKNYTNSSMPNERFFTFFQEKKFVCKNCGCLFSEKDEPVENNPTRISKRAFLKIIYTAFSDIYGKDFLDNNRKELIANYYKDINIFYEEVANYQAAMFYEADLAEKEDEVVKLLRASIVKKVEE